MSRRQTERGREFEAEVVTIMRALDFDAERVRSRNGRDGEADVVLRHNGEVWRVECKRRKRLPAVLSEAMQHEPNFAIFRADRSPAYAVIPLEDLLLLIREQAP